MSLLLFCTVSDENLCKPASLIAARCFGCCPFVTYIVCVCVFVMTVLHHGQNFVTSESSIPVSLSFFSGFFCSPNGKNVERLKAIPHSWNAFERAAEVEAVGTKRKNWVLMLWMRRQRKPFFPDALTLVYFGPHRTRCLADSLKGPVCQHSVAMPVVCWRSQQDNFQLKVGIGRSPREERVNCVMRCWAMCNGVAVKECCPYTLD